MVRVRVCNNCGRTIESAFLYCPWCGQAKNPVYTKNSPDSVFKRMEENQIQRRIEKLDKIEMELDALEKDLSVLVLSAEMAK